MRDHFQALAILRIGDLARDAAAATGVGHQHGVASGKREVGRQRGALAAPLLFDDLNENDLPALDDFLNLVGAHAPARPLRNFLERIFRAHLLQRSSHVLWGFGGVAGNLLDVSFAPGTLRRLPIDALRRGLDRLVVAGCRMPLFAAARLHGLAAAHVVLGMVRCQRSFALVAVEIATGLRYLIVVAVIPPIVVAPSPAFSARIGLGLCLGFGFGFFLKQRLPVGERDLIVVGMDFAEGQEPVAIAAVVHEGRLQRWLDPRDLGQVDIAAQRLARG